MRTPTKILAAGAALSAIVAAGAYAFAQQGPGFGPAMKMGMMGGHAPMMDGMRGRMGGMLGDPTARLDAIKAELGIKPEQTAAWDAYAKVITATATEQRSGARHIDPSTMRNMKPEERQQHVTTMQGQRDAAREKVTAAAATLLAQLDDSQKAKAEGTLPSLATFGPGMHFGMMGGPGAVRGMGPPWAR